MVSFRKHLLVGLLLGALLMGPQGAQASGSVGLNSITDNGEVTITGAYTSSDYGFAPKITQIDIPATIGGNPVVAISAGAFADLEDLKVVTLPEGLKTLGDYAFARCGWIPQPIVLPDSLETVGANPFGGTSVELSVSPDHKRLAVIDGALYDKQEKRLIYFPRNDNWGFSGLGWRTYTIPKGIEIIGEASFMWNHIEQLTLPDTVQRIERRAFIACDSLRDLKLPAGLKYVGDEAFYNCNGSLFGDDEILEFPEGVHHIGSQAIHLRDRASRSGIFRVVLPNSLKVLGELPFTLPDGVAVVQDNHPWLQVVDGVLFDKVNKRLLWYPNEARINPDTRNWLMEYAVPEGTLSIGPGAFRGLLKSITFPDSLVEIGDGALEFRLDMSYSEDGYTKGGTLMLGPNVERIGDRAFKNCSWIKIMHLGNKLQTLGKEALMDTDMTVIHVPATLTSIGDRAFAYCGLLKEINLGEALESVGMWAFSNCTSLTTLRLGPQVKSIGEGAFDGCTHLTLSVDRDSYAAQWALDKGIPVEYPDSLDWLNN